MQRGPQSTQSIQQHQVHSQEGSAQTLARKRQAPIRIDPPIVLIGQAMSSPGPMTSSTPSSASSNTKRSSNELEGIEFIKDEVVNQEVVSKSEATIGELSSLKLKHEELLKEAQDQLKDSFQTTLIAMPTEPADELLQLTEATRQ
eukprot:Gb_14102 [translate_table: standard]